MDQMFHLKSTLFLTVFAIWFLRVFLRYSSPCPPGLWAVLVGFGLVLPAAATLIGLLSGRTPQQGIRFSTMEMFLMLFLLLVIRSEEIDLVSILRRECIIIAFITLAIAVIAVFSPLLYNAIYEFTAAKQTAYLSIDTDRIGLGIGAFYYKTSATMILPMGYYTGKLYESGASRWRNLLLTLIYAAALGYSGARANALAAVAIIGLFTVKKLKDIAGWQIAIPVLFAMFSLAAATFLPKVFDPNEGSNSVKLKHWSSYVSEFEQHPSYLLWGEGADTEFYSAGFEEKTTITELTYVELVRNFGIPVAVLFLLTLAWPIFPLLSDYARSVKVSYLAISYGVYILIAGSNPLLLNTTGMLFVVSVWGSVLALRAKTESLTLKSISTCL